MSLQSGTRLGPYEILAAIGAGGMGEVYKAQDTRLGRTVALKVLPAGAAADPERRRRFEQEARAASALEHPHICVLHDIGSAVAVMPSAVPTSDPPHGVSTPAEPTDFLVMEHLEGQTLAQRLMRGPLPLDQALEAGAQIADALSAAHRNGIIHRDLKPANVMLTRSGVKLLDFGVAKLKAPPVGSAAGTTTLATQTEDGRVMGTAPYMAPEQVEAKPVDARTDLWAFGAVLYELVSGRRAFPGDTAASVMAAILERDPPAVASLYPETPPALDHLVRRCLAKAPDDRPDTAHDVADEVRWIREATGSAAAPDMQARHHPRLRAPLLIAIGGLLFAAGAGVMRLSRTSASLAAPALPVSPAEELNAGGVDATFLPMPGGSRTALTWTPDGRALVFVGRRGGVQQLYVRRLADSEARPLAATVGAQAPAVSPDGRWVAFWAGGAIRKAPLAGGPAIELTAAPTGLPRGLVWDESGGVFFGASDGRIWAIPASGPPAAVTNLGEAEVAHTLPWTLLGGRALLYTVRRRQWSWGDEDVVAHVLATGERKVVLKNATDARYVRTGHLVFLRRGVLFSAPFDDKRLLVRGVEVPMLDPIAQSLTGGNNADVIGAGQFAIAPTGTLAWVPGEVTPYPERALVTVDRRGQISPVASPARCYGPNVRVSPDGRRLAVTTFGLAEKGLATIDVARGSLTPLGAGGETNSGVWWASGRGLVFDWLKGGRRSLATQSADGATPVQVLLPLPPGRFRLSSVTPDGRIAAVTDGDIHLVTVEAGTVRVEPLIQTPHTEGWPAFSPDGRWLAYVSNQTGRLEVYLRPQPGSGPGEQVSMDGGSSPAWHPNGREVFFLDAVGSAPGGRMMAVDFAPGSPPHIGRPRVLFEFVQRELGFICSWVRCFDVAPDGERFYVVQPRTPPAPPAVTHINLIQNWFDDLKAKVPVR